MKKPSATMMIASEIGPRISPPILLGLALHRWRKNSGNLTIFTAIRRADSRTASI
jgi:hypothetical protein